MDLVGLKPKTSKNPVAEQKSEDQKESSRKSTVKGKKPAEIPEIFSELMEKEYGIKYHGDTKNQVKYVRNKINNAKDIMWSEFMNLKNIPDDTKQKILGSYKKINVKPFRKEDDVKLEDVEQ